MARAQTGRMTIALVCVALLGGCFRQAAPPHQPPPPPAPSSERALPSPAEPRAPGAKGGAAMTWELKSSAFSPGGDIPKPCTCDGPERSPALSWSEPPAKTKSTSLIMDDPDAPAGTWVHWVLYDLPPGARELSENVPKRGELPNGALQGQSDFRKIGTADPARRPAGN